MQALLEQFAQDHGNVARLLELLDRQCTHLRSGGAFDANLTSRILRYMVKYQDVFHHPKEDLLFGRLQQRNPGSSDVLTFLEREHQLLFDRGSNIHTTLSRGVEEDDCADLAASLEDYVVLLRTHMETENCSVYPNARVALSDADWREIDSQIDATPDPIFRDSVEQGYRVVIEALARSR